MLGTKPSNLINYFDFYRFAELLIDGKETASATPAALDVNPRAVAVVASAEIDVLNAVRQKQLYSLIVLQDLVRDYQLGGTPPAGTYGQQLVSIIADLAWKHAIKRKRYPEGTPQGDDPAAKISNEQLELLQKGNRIFVIEGMVQTDGMGNVIGTYGGQEKPLAGLLLGSTMRSDIGRPVGVWGDVGRRHHWDCDRDF